MFGNGLVHMVDIDDVGLAGLDASGEYTDPQLARLDGAQNVVVLGAGQRPILVVFHRTHEGVRDQHAVVQIGGLAVGVAAGGPA